MVTINGFGEILFFHSPPLTWYTKCSIFNVGFGNFVLNGKNKKTKKII